MTAGLLAVVVVTYFGSEHLASMLGWSWAALAYVTSGLESFGLWLFVAWVALRSRWAAMAAVPAVLAAFESGLRAFCRLSLPMERAPSLLRGQTMCEAAYGMSLTWVSILFAALAAVIVARCSGGRGPNG